MSAAAMSRTAEIRAVARDDARRAETMLTRLIADLFGIAVSALQINADQYSLNSLNGFFESEGAKFFFKFHQEEGEEQMQGEYYRAEILARAGLPVDQPVHISALPGEQLLVYRRRADPRFADVLLALDQTGDAAAIARAAGAEAALNDHCLRCAKDSLRPITPAQSGAEPIHRLFHARLHDVQNGFPGGRYLKFYVGQNFQFPGGLAVPWHEFETALPVINGLEYTVCFGEAFRRAHLRYAPENLADAGGIVAHGDAHNANVWYERGRDADHLAFFDPAFAGDKVPSLLAEVKSTFHNIFAHPFWLYHPDVAAQQFNATVRIDSGRLRIDTEWQLSAVRKTLLKTKAQHFWKPWLAHLSERGLLPADWEEVIRLGLFLSPTLVMNLRAGVRHNVVSSAIGLAVALAAVSPPVAGRDMFTDFFDAIRPGVA